MNTTQWPKLSETLSGRKRPGYCQACDRHAGGAIQIWREHDEQDRPTNVVVCLCEESARQIIDPHPRLYSKIEPNAPVPGAMEHLCLDCLFRDGVSCTHPKLKSNGGKGLAIIMPEQPVQGFWDGRDKQGRRTGGSFLVYSQPAIFCEGSPTAGDAAKLTETHRALLKKCLAETEE